MSGLQSFPGDVIVGDNKDDTATVYSTLSLKENPIYTKNWAMPLIDYKLSVGDYISTNGPICNGTAGSNYLVNTISLSPFICREDISIDTLTINVTAANVGAVAKIVIYDHDYTRRVPSGLLAYTPEFSTSAIGQPSVAMNYSFTALKQYWIGFWTGIATTTLTVATSGANLFNNSPIAFTQPFIGLAASLVYAAVPPSYCPSMTKNSSAAVVAMRISSKP